MSLCIFIGNLGHILVNSSLFLVLPSGQQYSPFGLNMKEGQLHQGLVLFKHRQLILTICYMLHETTEDIYCFKRV